MKVARPRIAAVVADQTLQYGVTEQFSREVAAYLLGERRINELSSVLRDVQADWADQGYVEVIARTAHPLNSQLKAQITKRVRALYPQAKQVIISEIHDLEVVGGLQLNLAQQQLDLTIRSKLDRFKQVATEGKA